jgi:hypothetical protein
MKENGTPSTFHAGVIIVVQDEDQVVGVVFTPHVFGASTRGKRDQPVVEGLTGIIAPAVPFLNLFECKPRSDTCQAVGPEMSTQDAEAAMWRLAVAFPLETPDPGPTGHRKHAKISACQNSRSPPGSKAAARPYMEKGYQPAARRTRNTAFCSHHIPLRQTHGVITDRGP